MLAIERRDCSGAAGFRGVLRCIEPQTQVIYLHRRSRGICRRIIIKYFWSRRCTGGNNEGLDVKAPSERLLANAIAVRLDIPLVPRQPEWCIGNLDHEKVEAGVGG